MLIEGSIVRSESLRLCQGGSGHFVGIAAFDFTQTNSGRHVCGGYLNNPQASAADRYCLRSALDSRVWRAVP